MDPDPDSDDEARGLPSSQNQRGNLCHREKRKAAFAQFDRGLAAAFAAQAGHTLFAFLFIKVNNDLGIGIGVEQMPFRL